MELTPPRRTNLVRPPTKLVKKSSAPISGMNVFLISVTCGHLEIVDQILNHLLCGGISRRSLQKTFSPVALAILFGQAHIFKYLLERSFDPNATTPLTGCVPSGVITRKVSDVLFLQVLPLRCSPQLWDITRPSRNCCSTTPTLR
jgi:hypothetical protein